MEKSESSVPRRKASGWIGGLISMLVQLVVWLLVSLLLSYLIEWTGMAFFWKAEGERHSQAVLASDLQYLNAHLQHDSLILKKKTILYAIEIKEAVADISWERRNKLSDKTLISSVHYSSLSHTEKLRSTFRACYECSSDRHTDICDSFSDHCIVTAYFSYCSHNGCG